MSTPKPWNSKDDEYLIQTYDEHNTAQQARELGRPYHVVSRRRVQLIGEGKIDPNAWRAADAAERMRHARQTRHQKQKAS